jgi:hypothetical protein
VEYENEKKLSINYARRFGQVALSNGFVNEEQLKEALTEQIAYDTFSHLRPHKLIGEILFENGWITLNQVEKVLEEMNSIE